MYTQFTMLFVVFSQLVIFLFKAVREKRNFRWSGLTLGFLLSGLLTFQLYALVLPQFSGTIGMKGTVPEWDSPLWTLTELSRGMRLSFQGSLAAVCAAIIFGLGFVNYLRTKPELPALFLLASGIGTAVVLVMRHPLWPRFYFFAVGFAALIAIRGAIVLAKPMAKSSMPGIVLCVAIILVSALAIPSAYRPKQDFLGAQDFVQTNRESDDSVVTIGRATLPYQGFYNANWSTAESLDELEEIRAKSERTWVVYMLPEDLENTHPDLMLRLHSDFKTVRQFEGSLAGGTIYVSVSSPHKIKDGSGQQIQQHQ
jgi:hypothetical protein